MVNHVVVLSVVSLLCLAGCQGQDKNLTGDLSAEEADTTVFYVAPDGSDNGPGTKDRPFATIGRA